MEPHELGVRVHRYRLAVIAIVGAPWLVLAVLAVGFDWRYSGEALVVSAVIDIALVAFACLRPGGVATWLILLRLAIGIVPALRLGGVGGYLLALFDLAAIVAVVVLLGPMWGSVLAAREQRREIRRGNALSGAAQRKALRRQARIERDGYL